MRILSLTHIKYLPHEQVELSHISFVPPSGMNTKMEAPHLSSEESLMSTIYQSLGCYFNIPNYCAYGESMTSEMPRGHVKFSHPRTPQDLHYSLNFDQMADVRANPHGNPEADSCVPLAAHWPGQVIHHPSSTGKQAFATDNSLQCGAEAPGKRRIRWTQELHEQFVEAVNHLGGAMKATPKGILRLMQCNGLTIFHIKSHLQKYRALTPPLVQGKSGSRISHARKIPSTDAKEGLYIAEALHLQKDVEKNLQEHLKAQRNLQMRIEAHTSHLKRMFVQQERSPGLLHHHVPVDAFPPSIIDFSSSIEQECYGEIYLNKARQFETSGRLHSNVLYGVFNLLRD